MFGKDVEAKGANESFGRAPHASGQTRRTLLAGLLLLCLQAVVLFLGITEGNQAVVVGAPVVMMVTLVAIVVALRWKHGSRAH